MFDRIANFLTILLTEKRCAQLVSLNKQQRCANGGVARR